MRRTFATLVVLAACGTLLAAPVPAETRKPAAFPAGHYVLAGAGEPAVGHDVFEFTKTFRLRQGQYVLSGGPKATDLILADDDLDLFQDTNHLFVDDDHVRTTETRGKRAAKYQGQPIVLVLDPAKKLRVRAADHAATEAIIGPLWLHRWDGARKKLTEGKSVESPAALPAAFFDESFTLGEGFEMPEKVSTDAETQVPEKPATLLPRFRAAPAAPSAPAAAEGGITQVTLWIDGVHADADGRVIGRALAGVPNAKVAGEPTVKKPSLIVVPLMGAKYDVGDLARTVAGTETPNRDKGAPSASLVLLYKPRAGGEAPTVKAFEKACSGLKGVDAAKSRLDAEKKQLRIALDSKGGAKLADIKAAFPDLDLTSP
jgi:hypothetical protein